MGFWATVIVASSLGIGIAGEKDGTTYDNVEDCLKRLPAFTSEILTELGAKDVEVLASRSGCVPVTATELAPILKKAFPTPEALLEWMRQGPDAKRPGHSI